MGAGWKMLILGDDLLHLTGLLDTRRGRGSRYTVGWVQPVSRGAPAVPLRRDSRYYSTV